MSIYICRECNDAAFQYSDKELTIYKRALEESIKLQSHYAKLLNMYDGGTRLEFTVDSWMRKMDTTQVKPND